MAAVVGAVVVVAVQWCLSPTPSQILFTTLGRNRNILDRSHRSGQTPTDCGPSGTTTQRLRHHRLLIMEFQSHVLLSVKNYQAPRANQRRQGRAGTHTQERSQDFLHKNIELGNMFGNKNFSGNNLMEMN